MRVTRWLQAITETQRRIVMVAALACRALGLNHETGDERRLTLHTGSSPMNARSTRLAPRHVNPRRACPAPFGQLAASPGERGSKNSGSSEAHLVQAAFLLFPLGTTDHETPKQYLIGEVQVSYISVLAPFGENGKGEWAKIPFCHIAISQTSSMQRANQCVQKRLI